MKQQLQSERSIQGYLKEGVEDFEDLLLHQHRVTRGVWQQLDETVFQHGHEDLHGSNQGLTLIRFLVPVTKECSEQLNTCGTALKR